MISFIIWMITWTITGDLIDHFLPGNPNANLIMFIGAIFVMLFRFFENLIRERV